jgi:acetyl-CoA carboxylase biotin carboxylase subunit
MSLFSKSQKIRPIKKILIANRGEIAIRVIRACRELGIRAVAVYSEADRRAQHVLMAHEAFCIGPAPARESYLRGDVIIETAKYCSADAIHPGYGFLAENGDFAEAVEASGLIFIGPPASAMRAMGSKTEARRIMMDAGVPVVPGDRSGLADAKAAHESAERIGYPVMIKAAMGGGGKGMRLVRAPEELTSAFESARRESETAFGSGEVYLEKLIENPRHVEVQIMGDAYGNVLHFFERECSIQRRHQKVIEESPAPALNDLPKMRDEMCRAAVAAAKACGYVNAGTVEFLFDQTGPNFYFLEMNTRLQVEHPVTEMVTGIDLAQLQIMVAMGHPHTLKQSDIQQNGCSIECRIYAEDPFAGFLPDAGRITSLVRPAGPWVRVDSGVNAGDEVGVYYDPMVAKLIVWGQDRPDAIKRMKRALDEYRITGFKTTVPFERWVMDQPQFKDGCFDTGFIDREFRPELMPPPDDWTIWAAALSAVLADGEYSPSANGSTRVDISQTSITQTSESVKTGGSWKQAGRLRRLG